MSILQYHNFHLHCRGFSTKLKRSKAIQCRLIVAVMDPSATSSKTIVCRYPTSWHKDYEQVKISLYQVFSTLEWFRRFLPGRSEPMWNEAKNNVTMVHCTVVNIEIVLTRKLGVEDLLH